MDFKRLFLTLTLPTSFFKKKDRVSTIEKSKNYIILISSFFYMIICFLFLINSSSVFLVNFKSYLFGYSLEFISKTNIYLENLMKIVDLSKNYFSNRNEMNRELIALKEENRELIKWKFIAKELLDKNKKLEKQVNIVNHLKLDIKTTNIVTTYLNYENHILVIHGGESDGFIKNQIVLNSDGIIVGRIQETMKNGSHVLLITDRASRVPVVLEGTENHAILVGQNNNNLSVIWSSESSPDLNVIYPGLKFITSGLGGVFPAGFPIAEIISIHKNKINIQPLGRLDYLVSVVCKIFK